MFVGCGYGHRPPALGPLGTKILLAGPLTWVINVKLTPAESPDYLPKLTSSVCKTPILPGRAGARTYPSRLTPALGPTPLGRGDETDRDCAPLSSVLPLLGFASRPHGS